MKENIEEDIKILENWLEELNKLFNKTHINNTKERNALDHILSDYKKILKENEELKADNYELNNRINDLLDNIPVQKVKDKMENLNKEIKNAEVTEAIFKIKQQQVLQELLEGR